MKTIARSLFEHYRQNLNAFRAHPRVTFPSELLRDDIVVCPLCLKYFYTLDAINLKHLTVEHAPPHALQGDKVALTCQSCNNADGSLLDTHVIAYIRQLDAQQAAGNGPPAKQPKPLSQKLTLNLSTLKPKKVQYGLLKSAYILAFSQLGYGLLWNTNMDKVRLQLQHPDQVHFPAQAVQLLDTHPVHDNFLGINIITDPPEARCFYVIFDVALPHAAPHRIGVMLPGPHPHDFDWFDRLLPITRQKLHIKLRHCPIAWEDKLTDPLLTYKLMDTSLP